MTKPVQGHSPSYGEPHHTEMTAASEKMRLFDKEGADKTELSNRILDALKDATQQQRSVYVKVLLETAFLKKDRHPPEKSDIGLKRSPEFDFFGGLDHVDEPEWYLRGFNDLMTLSADELLAMYDEKTGEIKTNTLTPDAVLYVTHTNKSALKELFMRVITRVSTFNLDDPQKKYAALTGTYQALNDQVNGGFVVIGAEGLTPDELNKEKLRFLQDDIEKHDVNISFMQERLENKEAEKLFSTSKEHSTLAFLVRKCDEATSKVATGKLRERINAQLKDVNKTVERLDIIAVEKDGKTHINVDVHLPSISSTPTRKEVQHQAKVVKTTIEEVKKAVKEKYGDHFTLTIGGDWNYPFTVEEKNAEPGEPSRTGKDHLLEDLEEIGIEGVVSDLEEKQRDAKVIHNSQVNKAGERSCRGSMGIFYFDPARKTREGISIQEMGNTPLLTKDNPFDHWRLFYTAPNGFNYMAANAFNSETRPYKGEGLTEEVFDRMFEAAVTAACNSVSSLK